MKAPLLGVRILLAAMVAVSMAARAGEAAPAFAMAVEPFSYQEGFEGQCPALESWAKDGPSTTTFAGASEERAFEGKRSLKLDVTLDGGSYHYFGVPVRAPCAGKLTLSARVFVGEGTTARVGFGTNMAYPPTHLSGCGPTRVFDKPTNQWELVEIDLVERGKNGAAGVMANCTATGDDVGAILDRWSLFIMGDKGQRAVVYVDEVRIEGQAPSEADYVKEVDQRWAKGQERLRKRLDAWGAQLAEAQQAMNAMPEAPPTVQPYADQVKASVEQAGGLIEKLAKAGYGSREEPEAIESVLFVVRYGPETIRAIAQGMTASQPYLVYAPRAITNVPLASGAFPIPARVAEKLACSGCRGECESVTAAVYAIEDVKQMLVSVGNLSGPGGTIPSSAVDVRIVKCWYQAGTGNVVPNKKVYVPELLLKDANLVRVDLEKGDNYLRSTAEDGTESYLLCSGPSSENLANVRPIDGADLKPVDVPARALQQFWLTAHIPADAGPGVYTGEVSFKTASGAKVVSLEVTVHPFELMPSRLTYSIYYRGILSADGKPGITSEDKSEEQFRAEMGDMLAHGVLYPANYQGYDERLLRRVLEIRKEVGLPAGRFYNLGLGTGNAATPAELAQLGVDVKRWSDFVRPFGYTEVYTYGIDEAGGERLAAQRTAWRTVQEAGGKTFVACYLKTFEAMGNLLNCAVLAGRPDPDEARKWHSVGSEVFCYAYPQVGVEEPETYRRNFGLALWKAGFDGAMDYAYQHAFGHIWDDFDNSSYRDHNFTYPTVNGIVGTLQWEGFREAVDDVRYVTTLENAIKNAPAAKSGVAEQAWQWLDGLDPDTAELDQVRAQMVELIGKLGSK